MGIFHEWRRWIRPMVICIYVVIILIALPFVIVELQAQKVHPLTQGWFIGGIFVLMAIPISVWGILEHCIHYTQPLLQRHIIRIIWMVPIYAANAWFALRFYSSALYLDTLRECYEAYVIYNFMAYLLAFLRSEHPDLEEHLEKKPQVKHIIPFCLFPKWNNGRQILSYCKHGVLQYTVIRPIMTGIAFITQITDTYNEGVFSPTSAWVYLTFINNCSQMWAMYCLVLFYKATKEELAPMRPVPKFLCIKAVVFFSFWQSVFISILVYFNVIPDTELLPSDHIASSLQDFLICIEMFLAAVAHYYSFSHKPFVDYAQGHQNWFTSFKDMFDIRDVRDDVVNHVRIVGATATEAVTRPLRKAPVATETEKSPLLRQCSNASSEVDIGVTSGDNEYVYSATPPVVLTQHDFYNSVESSHSDAQLAHGSVQQPSAGRVIVVNVHQTVEVKTDGLTTVTNEHLNTQRMLIDFTSEVENPETQGSNLHNLDDACSTYTVGSATSEAYQRQSLTASMSNYAPFGEPSVSSTRSTSPSRSPQISEK